MTELLNIDPKEEDFECREEFPGTVYGPVFLCSAQVLRFLLCCMVLDSLLLTLVYRILIKFTNLMIHVAILS